MKVRDFFIFGVASGLNRAGIFLLTPIIAIYLSPSDFGELSLYLVSAVLFSTFLSMNISAIIAREVLEDLIGVVRYVRFFNFFSIFSLILCTSLLLFFYKPIVAFFIFIIVESLFLVNSTYIRFKGGAMTFLYLTLSKFILFCSGFTLAVSFDENIVTDVTFVLLLLAFSNTPILYLSARFFLINFHVKYNFLNRMNVERCNKKYLLFAMTLLPHIIAQWFNSGADRFFVKFMCSPEDLGLYSFSYSLSSFLLIVNAALALGLPQLCMKDKVLYSSAKVYKYLFVSLSTFYLSTLLFLSFIVPKFEDYDSGRVLDISFVICSGMYFLSFYVYFSSILFYERKSWLISKITMFVCLVSLLLLYPLTYWFGVMGTAVVTFFAYFIYMLIVWNYSLYNERARLIFPIIIVIIVLSFKFYFY